jgi:acyl carrier protein
MTDVPIALAQYLRIPVEAILDTQRLKEDLGLDSLDLVTIVLKLEDLEPYHGEFPVGLLENTRTVSDLVALHRDWSDRDTLEQIIRVSLTDVVIVDDRPVMS